jgi:carbamoyl-phosphate synthase large subunit
MASICQPRLIRPIANPKLECKQFPKISYRITVVSTTSSQTAPIGVIGFSKRNNHRLGLTLFTVLCTSVGNQGFPSVREALVAYGDVTVFGVDSDPLAVGLRMVEHSSLVPPRGRDLVTVLQELIRLHDIDVLLPLSTQDQTFFAPLSNAFDCSVAVSSPASVALANDNLSMYEFGLTKGWPLPSGQVVQSPDALIELMSHLASTGGKLVIKRPQSTGSQGVKVVCTEVDFWRREFTVTSTDDVLRWIESGNFEPVLVTEFVDGEHVSVDGFRFTDDSLRLTARTEERHLFGGSLVGRSCYETELFDSARRILEDLDLTYAFNMEFLKHSDGRYRIIEVNPRFPSSVAYSTSRGLNLPRLSVLQALNLPPDSEWTEPATASSYHCYWSTLTRSGSFL